MGPGFQRERERWAAAGPLLSAASARGKLGLAQLTRLNIFFLFFFLFLFLETFLTFKIYIQMDSNKFVKICKTKLYQTRLFGNNFEIF